MGISSFTGNNTGQPPANNNNNQGGTMGLPPGGGLNFAGAMGRQILAEEDILALMINMNQSAHAPCLFRDKVIEQLLSVLIGCQKPNAILIGQAGTGKTAIVEEVAHMIDRKDAAIPPMLYGYTIFNLPLSNIMEGTRYRGDLELKLNSILDYLTDPANKAIIFIDEIHMLFSGDESYREVAQVLKPALSRGSLHVIGATTTSEVKKLEKDPAFNRRFDRVLVDELSKEQTLTILNNLKSTMLNHYQAPVIVNDDELRMLIDTADDYMNAGSHRPDNAITLFDRSIADMVLQRQAMLNSPDQNMQMAAKNMIGLPLTEKNIKKTAMRIATGNNEPAEFDEQAVLDNIRDIKGQDETLQELMRFLKISAAKLHPTKKPFTMLFAGPSGVGKTEVTKRIAESYFKEKPIILNMTEYSQSHSISKILGSPAGYVGYSDNNEMPFDVLKTNPYQVILLDEFEKCHKSVQRLFMRVFDEGILEDATGHTIDFSKTIIIVTTNAGCTNTADAIGFSPIEQKISAKLENYFDTELLGRFENRILQFNSISKDTFRDIMAEDYAKETAFIKKTRPRAPLNDEMPEDDLKALTEKTYNVLYGARPIHAAVVRYIDDIMVP